MINTDILDINFQNKISQSTEQYFEGKMFNQNYFNMEDNKNFNEIKSTENNNEIVIKKNNFQKENDEEFKTPLILNKDDNEKPKRKSKFDQ